MQCPIDGTTLETHTIHSINIEECVQCRGLWFEEGELSKAKDESDPDLNWLDFDLWSDRLLWGYAGIKQSGYPLERGKS